MPTANGIEDGPAEDRDERQGRKAELDITLRVVLTAWLGGLAGLVVMAPGLVGVPILLDVFRAEPLADIAELGRVFGLEPNVFSGVAVFVAGAVIGLPLLFIVAATFLPPREPRIARGAVFATIMWSGFVIAYWPGGPLRTIGLFVGLSLVTHWLYGLTLGGVLQYLTYIPDHDV